MRSAVIHHETSMHKDEHSDHDLRIQKIIQELKAELENAEVADPDKRARLERLIESIDGRLEGHLEEDHHQELVEELREEAMEFDVEHPDISGTIRSFLNMLSSIGI